MTISYFSMVEHNITRLHTKFHIFIMHKKFSYELYKNQHIKEFSGKRINRFLRKNLFSLPSPLPSLTNSGPRGQTNPTPPLIEAYRPLTDEFSPPVRLPVMRWAPT